MPLLETDALTIRSTFDSLPDEAKPLASDWLRRYKDQQDEFGLPLFPSEVETQQADESAFVSMFDDVKQVDPGNGIYDQAERLKSGEGDRLRQREAGMRFLAKHYRDEEKVRRDFPLYRDDYAMKNGGKRDMGDGEFYSFVSQQVKRQQGQKLVRSRSLDAGFRAAIEGMGSLEKLAAVKSQAATNADSEVDAGAFLEAYGETQKVMSKHAAFIREYSDTITANMDGGNVNLEPLNERLLDIPGTERRIVIAALNLEAQKQGKKVKADKGEGYGKALSQMLQGAFMGASEEGGKFWQQTGESAFRIAANAATDARQYETFVNLVPETGSARFSGTAIKTPEDARKYVRESIAQDIFSRAASAGAGPGGVGAFPPMDSRNEITLDETAQRLIQDAKEREMKRLRVANEIRSIGEAADPIPNVFASTIGTSGAALALMAGTRGLAAPALASAYTNIEFNDLSLKYPQMSTADKTQIAAISGAAQAALDYVGVKALDKLPGIKSLIAQPLTKQLAGRALARGALSFGQENLVEAGQDIATPALMQALKSDVPGFDWEAEQREFWKGRADVAIGLLPLTLLGIGAASVNEYRGAKKLLSWNDQLGAAGVVETDRVAVIEAAQSGDMGKAQSLLMEAWGRRNPEVAAEYQDAMRQRQTDMSRATAELERLGAIPTLRRDGDGWTVTSNGTSTKFATWEEARDVATAAMGDMERAQTELVASLSDSFMASTPAFLKGESVEFNTDAKGESLVDRVNAGAMTPEQAMEAAVAGGVIKGVTMQEARAIAAEVFGGQNASERAMQFRQDVEKIAVLGRNTVQNGQSRSIVNAAGNERSFLTVVEEVVEGRWKGGLERRAFTKDMGIRWVQLAEAATGETFLEGSTWEEIAASSETAPRALTEAISRIIVADVLGRMKDGKRIGPGTVSSGLNLNDREQSALAAILDAFRKLFRALLETASKLAKARQEGKLGGEYDALFDALTGGSSQVEHDAVAEEIGTEIVQKGVDTSGYSEETPGPNGETFSASRAIPADASKVVQMPDGARLVGPTTFSIRVFHGTPHKVDKFTTAKIGTGEGAQAYGWGLYFAENREVGEQYKKQLSSKYPVSHSGVIEENGKYLAWVKPTDGRDVQVIHTDATQKGAKNALKKYMADKRGNLYTVELLPDESDFLDWDKPLSEQSEKVKAAIENAEWDGPKDRYENGKFIGDVENALAYSKRRGEAMNGADLYRVIVSAMRPKAGAGIAEMQKASQKLASLGIPGIRYLDGGSRGAGDGTRNYVIFDENLVRILEENGKPVSQETFSLRVTPAQDAEYMAAVEAGDMETAQAMVDEAAKAAGYDVKAYHGTPDANFDIFKEDQFFTKDEKYAKRFTDSATSSSSFYGVRKAQPRVLALFLKTKKVFDTRIPKYAKLLKDKFSGKYGEGVLTEMGLPDWVEGRDIAEFLRDEIADDFDAVIVDEGKDNSGQRPPAYIVFNPSQIKSADPVTRDESGNVIPLSQRFNPADDRITYSLRPGDFAARMEAKFSLFRAKPELRLAITQVAKERALRFGAEWIAKGDVIRTAKDIGKEARMREALAYEARMNEYLDGLMPNARQTLEFEPSALEDDPLVAAMLDFGKLMSFTTAKKSGKVEAKSGDYDGQPWLPPAWFSKGMGIMPDQMAQAMFDAGMLPDAYTGTLWSELEKRIESTRKDKAAHREAVQAYKAAEKYARDASRAEADQWAENAKKQAGSPKAQRDMLKAALGTLDGILAAAPPEVRARVGGYVKLAGLATDEAMLQEIERRIDKLNVELEKWLKKDATGSINRLFKRAAADYTAGKKAKGKLGPDEHYLFQRAEAASEMDAPTLRGQLANLDVLADDESLSDDQRALAVLERGIVELVGDMKNADSGRLFTAFDELSRLYSQGVVAWKAKQTARREARQAVRDALKADAGKSGVLKERQAMEKAMTTLFGKAKSAWLSVSSFSEVLRYAFGSKSQQATELIDGEREASNAYEDEQQAIADELESLFTSMAGGKVLDGERLRFDMAKRTIKAGDVELSQFEAITALLMWRQEDGRRHMEGTFDENGQRTSGWSYDQAWIDEVEKQLTPEGRRVMAWLAAKYGSEHGELNALYRERHGVNLPAHDNYAPITVKPMQAKAGEIVDPVSGAAVSGSILTPGSLRTRSRMAIAEPEFRDALQTFVGHKKQMGYWKAYYDLATDVQAVLGNRELMNSVEAAAGSEAVTVLGKWMTVLAQGGVRDAAAGLAMNSMFQRMMSRAATVGLLGRVSTLLVQSTQLAAASVQMPVGAYLRRFGKLLAGQLDWKGALQSDFIQRRIQTAPPIVRQAMENLGTATRPNLITRAVRNLGNLLSGADGLFTGGTYAILLDYHRETGRKLGLTGADLEEHAHREAERATEQVAQPTRTATRSLAEITATNPLAKVSFAYASEARQKIALLGWSLANFKADPVRFGKAAFLVFGVGGVMSQVLKNIWKEAKGDDDEEKWSPERLIKGSVVNALHGMPMMAEIMGEPGMFSSTAWAQAALDDLLKGEADLRDINTLLGTLGLFNDTAAGIAAMSNAGYDFAKIIEAAFSE